MKRYILTFLILLIAGITYIKWLDSGCEYGGYMAWDGKNCYNYERYLKTTE